MRVKTNSSRLPRPLCWQPNESRKVHIPGATEIARKDNASRETW